jgi:hypothetical protein
MFNFSHANVQQKTWKIPGCPNIPDHKDEYSQFLNELFRKDKPNISCCSIEYLRRAAVGRGRAPPSPTSPEKGEEGSATAGVRVRVQGCGWCQGFALPPPSLSSAGLGLECWARRCPA